MFKRKQEYFADRDYSRVLARRELLILLKQLSGKFTNFAIIMNYKGILFWLWQVSIDRFHIQLSDIGETDPACRPRSNLNDG